MSCSFRRDLYELIKNGTVWKMHSAEEKLPAGVKERVFCSTVKYFEDLKLSNPTTVLVPIFVARLSSRFLVLVEVKKREFRAKRKQTQKDKFEVVLNDILYSYPNGVKYQSLLLTNKLLI